MEIALQNSSSVKKAENTVRLQGADLLKSYGQFLPKVSVSAGYTPLSVSRVYSNPASGSVLTTRNENVDLNLTTSLNLFNGFKDYASLQSAINLREASGFSLFRARQTIAYDVTQSYYQVLLDTELLKIARENLLSSQDQLQLTERQYEIGLKPVTDYYQQQAETANDELSVIRAENTLRSSTLELVRKLRIDHTEEVAVAEIPIDALTSLPSSVDPDSLVTLGLANRTDLQSAVFSTEAAKWDVTSASSQRYPTLDLAFSLNTLGYPYYETTAGTPHYLPLSDQLSDLLGYSLSITLNWTLFDGFLTRYNVEQAKVNYLNEELDTADLEHDIAIDIQLAVDNYSAAFTEIETAKQGLRAAEKAYETVKKKYDLGSAGFVEASTAKATLVSARSEYSQAIYNLALQKNILDFATGILTVE
ncbi:TolC family protein [Prosthecochloris sp.]|uniref:TolC family protein n=1 Tax=Prosthecochloris sp. TaxID=290513 RepID=UPI00257F8720|nr:TolC family protein [Prosthecochloris sp.]